MSEERSQPEARKRLYEIVRQDVPFDEKAREALELGAAVLNVDTGHLTSVDPETDHWKAMVSTDTDGGLTPPEHELDLRETYCRRTIADREQLAVHNVPEEWPDDPAVDTRELACYLGTPIILDGDPCGTVCFVASDPREPFGDAETRFAELLSALLERELARERVETELDDQTNLTTVLNRVLRHNLRNEMSVIRGFANLMTDELDDQSHGETVIGHIDDLMALSEKARQLERIITTDAERTETDMHALATHVVERASEEHPGADITVAGDSDITAAVLPTFERAIQELVENAVKHSGDAPTVTVTVETVPDAVEINITDDGPGLSEQEIDVLNRGIETPFTHGSGLGLWMAHWIVDSHGGEIDPTVTVAGTMMSVSVPRRSARRVHRDEPALAREPDRYQASFAEAHDAMVVVNDDGRIIDANPAAGTLLGRDAQELHGRGLPDFLPADFDFEGVLTAAERPGGNPETVRINAADGSSRIVEYTAAGDIVPGQHLFVARDVTERVAREAELSRKTQAMDAAPIGIILTDPTDEDNPIVYANEAFAEITGYDESEIIGRNCRFLQADDTDPDIIERMRHGIEAGETVSVTLRNRRKDGTPFWNHVTIAPVEAGGEELMVGFQEDVTDRLDRSPSLEEPP